MKVTTKVVLAVAGALVAGSVVTAGAAGAFGPMRVGLASDSSGSGSHGAASGRLVQVTSRPVSPTSRASSSVKANVTSPQASAGSMLSAGGTLGVNQYLLSANGKYGLVMQSDGNLVDYRVSDKKALWTSQTSGHDGASARLGTNGDAEVVDASGSPLWNSGTTGSGNALLVQDDGNVVVYSSAKKALWSSQAEAFTLYPNQGLFPGQARTSPNGDYYLIQQTDGNLVEYTSAGKAVWTSQTSGHTGAATYLGSDGNVVVYSAGKTPLFATATEGHDSGNLVVQDDGNVVVRDSSGTPLWSTQVDGGSKLDAGQWLSVNQYRTSPNGRYLLVEQSDGNLVLLDGKTPIWSSGTDHHPGASAKLQEDGNLVVSASGGAGLWGSATNGKGGTYLMVQNDGNAVLYTAGQRAVWSTQTGGK